MEVFLPFEAFLEWIFNDRCLQPLPDNIECTTPRFLRQRRWSQNKNKLRVPLALTVICGDSPGTWAPVCVDNTKGSVPNLRRVSVCSVCSLSTEIWSDSRSGNTKSSLLQQAGTKWHNKEQAMNTYANGEREALHWKYAEDNSWVKAGGFCPPCRKMCLVIASFWLLKEFLSNAIIREDYNCKGIKAMFAEIRLQSTSRWKIFVEFLYVSSCVSFIYEFSSCGICCLKMRMLQQFIFF